MRVLLTGGAGYIGAHTAVALSEAGHEIAVVDDLSAVSGIAVDRIRELTGAEVPLLVGDVRDADAVQRFAEGLGGIDAVVHLAGLKSVAESVADPVRYYDENVAGAVGMLRAARAAGARTIVFSSSATVYADGQPMPVTEASAAGLDQASPYGKSKRVIEELLRDVAAAEPGLRAVCLRYFNPVGAHPSGRIGEDPLGEPQNLMPVIARAAAGLLSAVTVNGDDYDTPDGTAQRDYIHVTDLAAGHVAAIEHAPPGWSVFNLGTGAPVSVRELIDAFEAASGQTIATRIGPRRPGDLPVSFADPGLARRELGWRAERTIAQACEDYWRWQSANPRGYVG